MMSAKDMLFRIGATVVSNVPNSTTNGQCIYIATIEIKTIFNTNKNFMI